MTEKKIDYRGKTFTLRVEDDEDESYIVVTLSVHPARADGDRLYSAYIKAPRR